MPAYHTEKSALVSLPGSGIYKGTLSQGAISIENRRSNSKAQGSRITLSQTLNDRNWPGHVDDRRGQAGTEASIHHTCQLMRVTFCNLFRIRHGIHLAFRNQCRGYQGRLRGFQQCQRSRMGRNSNTYGLARRMRNTPGHLSAGFENKCPRTWSRCFQQTILRIIHTCKMPNFRQVAAQQSQVMLISQTAQTPQCVCSCFVIQLGDDGIT